MSKLHKNKNTIPELLPVVLAKKKVKIASKLTISPLNQELKPLQPVTPVKMLSLDPSARKHSTVDMNPSKRPRKSKVSPETREDPERVSFINKEKAKKLILLQQTINKIPKQR